MKISSVQLPPIHEEPAKWNASSQEARIESFTNSDAPLNLHAARLQRSMQTFEPVPLPRMQQPNQPQQQKPTVKAWKTFCHRASILCGLLFFPSFACLAFGVVGLCVPAALLVAGFVLGLLGGKPPEEVQAARDERAAQNAVYDPR